MSRKTKQERMAFIHARLASSPESAPKSEPKPEPKPALGPVSDSITLLMEELPGLYSAKAAIDKRIAEILAVCRQGNPVRRDSLGRIIVRRNISPQAREQKRQLIAMARAKRLDKLKSKEGIRK